MIISHSPRHLNKIQAAKAKLYPIIFDINPSANIAE
jgi:hypothetical protein